MNLRAFHSLWLTLQRFAIGLLLVIGLTAVLAAPATAQSSVTVVEYYNKTVAAYLLTGRAA